MLALSACSNAPRREATPPPPAPPTHDDRVIDHVAHDVLFLAISMVGPPGYAGTFPYAEGIALGDRE